MDSPPTFTGYRRENGRIGVRNHVAVVPTSVAASSIASRLASDAGAWARATPHQMGTSQPDATRRQTERVLAGIARNPNVGAALVVELGTEDTDAEALADRIAETGKSVETLTIREVGGTSGSLDRGATLLAGLNESAEEARREEADASELVFGVECGGSDATSGIAANPAVGEACDRLVGHGGTACFSETPEFIGAEHVLAERCVDEDVRERLLDRVDRREKLADLMGVDIRGAQPTPGNQEGGLTTIEEKSLGAISKGGTTPVCGMVDYAEDLPVGGGLVLMDTPGYDVESVVGKVAGGAQVIAFTTGRGSTTGNPIAPVIKVTGNPKTYARMANNMDVNASTVIDGDPLEAVGGRVYETLLAVADGQPTEAERRRLEEFAINEIMPNELAELEVRGMKGEVLDDVALRMTPDDNVVTALDDLEAGHGLTFEGSSIELTGDVPFGHKFALVPIDAGEQITKYGYVIGRASEPIAPGDWVHVHNVESTRGRGDLQERGGEAA